MPRPPFDLRYEHVVRAMPVQPTAPSREIVARDLRARLGCLKALMDADRSLAPRPVPRVLHS